jgi:hypothetical protein
MSPSPNSIIFFTQTWGISQATLRWEHGLGDESPLFWTKKPAGKKRLMHESAGSVGGWSVQVKFTDWVVQAFANKQHIVIPNFRFSMGTASIVEAKGLGDRLFRNKPSEWLVDFGSERHRPGLKFLLF